MHRRTFLIASSSFLLTTRALGQTPQLEATLAIEGPSPAHFARELVLRATLTNHVHQSWRMPMDTLSIAQLSVDVLDARGQRMATVPPPVPPATPSIALLGQDQSHVFRIPLGVFSPELPPGDYTVRWGASLGIVANTPRFTIVA